MDSVRAMNLPILFTYRDTVFGNGFVAEVVTNGCFLFCEEEGGTWIYGVQPGDLAEGGRNFAEAHTEFRRSFTKVLFDIANDAEDFEAFKSGVQEFFNGVNAEVEREWTEAVNRVRQGRIETEAAQLSIEGLPRKDADSPRSVSVEQKLAFVPLNNTLEPEPAIAA